MITLFETKKWDMFHQIRVLTFLKIGSDFFLNFKTVWGTSVLCSFLFFQRSYGEICFGHSFSYKQYTFPNIPLYMWKAKESSFCGTPAKNSKVMILRLRYHQDSQVAIYIDTKLWTSKVINQKTLISKKVEITNFILKECTYTVLLLLL